MHRAQGGAGGGGEEEEGGAEGAQGGAWGGADEEEGGGEVVHHLSSSYWGSDFFIVESFVLYSAITQWMMIRVPHSVLKKKGNLIFRNNSQLMDIDTVIIFMDTFLI